MAAPTFQDLQGVTKSSTVRIKSALLQHIRDGAPWEFLYPYCPGGPQVLSQRATPAVKALKMLARGYTVNLLSFPLSSIKTD